MARQDHLGNQVVHHKGKDGEWLELRLARLTESQARATVANILRENGYDPDVLWQFGAKPTTNLTALDHDAPQRRRINWISFVNGVLALSFPS